FFVLNVGEIDQAALNGLDYEALWRSIDEDLEDGYTGAGAGRDLVAEVQATYKPHTVIDEWLDMGDEVPAREGEAEAGGEWLSLRDSYDVFHRYCKKYNLPAAK